MDPISLAESLEDDRLDHLDRVMRKARHCVRFAVLTPEPLAAELLDKAIELRTSSQTTMPGID